MLIGKHCQDSRPGGPSNPDPMIMNRRRDRSE
jgi:hypothetical protein